MKLIKWINQFKLNFQHFAHSFSALHRHNSDSTRWLAINNCHCLSFIDLHESIYKNWHADRLGSRWHAVLDAAASSSFQKIQRHLSTTDSTTRDRTMQIKRQRSPLLQRKYSDANSRVFMNYHGESLEKVTVCCRVRDF